MKGTNVVTDSTISKSIIPSHLIKEVSVCADGFDLKLSKGMFLGKDGSQKLIDVVADMANAMIVDADVNTTKGREAYVSASWRVVRSKTWLLGIFKQVHTAAMQGPNAIRAAQNHLKRELDALRIEIRRPVTEWESEQATKRAQELEAQAKAAAQQATPPVANPPTVEPTQPTQQTLSFAKAPSDTIEAFVKLGVSPAVADLLIQNIRDGKVPHIRWID